MALAYVNTVTGLNDASGTGLATSGMNVTTGNLLVAACLWFGGTRTVNNITDTAGNTWMQATGALNTSHANDRIDMWYCQNATGNASNVMTFNLNGAATFRRIVVNQYSGAALTGAFDVASPGFISTGTTVTTGNLVTSQANEVIVACSGSDNSQTYTAGSGFQLRGSTIGTDTRSEDMFVTSTSTYTASITGTASGVFYMTAAAFKEALPPPIAVSAWLTA